MAELNIETFNTILMKAAKDEEAKIKLIEMEIDFAHGILVDKTAQLLEELEKSGYQSKTFQEIKNITENVNVLIDKLDELQNEKEESKK